MLIVAEIGSLHSGSKSLAFEMMRQAKLAGADVAKFQFGWPEDDELRYVDDWAEDLVDFSWNIGIELMASIWSLEALDIARSIDMRRYKIAHQLAYDSEHAKLRNAIYSDGKETYVSYPEPINLPINARQVYVVPKYPAYPPFWMPHIYGAEFIGYSDHSHGIGACALAAARGAQYIEKHFTIAKDNLATRDSPFSADLEEMRQLVHVCREIERVR